MTDEQELFRQLALEGRLDGGWNEESCAEYEAFLDEMYWESRVDQLEDEYNEAMERRAYMEQHVTGRDPF